MKFLEVIKEYIRESLEWHFISFLIESSIAIAILQKISISFMITIPSFIAKIIIYCYYRYYVKR